MVNVANWTHGKPGTYGNGCRCDSCRDAWRLYARGNPAHKAYKIAERRAAEMMREHTPDLWQQLLNEAYADLGATRKARTP